MEKIDTIGGEDITQHQHGENGFHSRVILHTGSKAGYYLEAICVDDGVVYQNNRINEDLKARE